MPKARRTDSRLWRGEQPAQTHEGTEHRKLLHFLVDGAERWTTCQVKIKSGARKGEVCGSQLVEVLAPCNVHLGRQTSKRAAAEVTSTAKVEASKGTFVNPAKARVMVNDELANWLEIYHRPRVAANSFQSSEIVLRRHVYPRFQGVSLAECSYSSLQAVFTRWVADQGHQTPTMKKAKRFLTAMFTIAERDGKVARNPMVGVEIPTPAGQRLHRATRITAWSPDQLTAFFDWLSDPYRTLFYTASRTGLRDSELCGLRIEDVTFGPCGDERCRDDGAHLHVRQVRRHVPGGVVVAPPKSANSERVIPIGSSLEAELRAYRVAHPAIAGLFFTDAAGEGIKPNDMSMRFARQLAKYRLDHDVPRIGLHGLRHSFITNLLAAGMNATTVSKLAGHHSMSYSVDVYGHLMPDAARAAVDQLEAALGGGQG